MSEAIITGLVLGCITLGPFLGGMLFEKLAHRTGRNPRTLSAHTDYKN